MGCATASAESRHCLRVLQRPVRRDESEDRSGEELLGWGESLYGNPASDLILLVFLRLMAAFARRCRWSFYLGRSDYDPPVLFPTVSPKKVKLIRRRLRSLCRPESLSIYSNFPNAYGSMRRHHGQSWSTSGPQRSSVCGIPLALRMSESARLRSGAS